MIIRTESKSEQLNRLGLPSLVLEKSNGQVPVPLWYTAQCGLCLDCVIFVTFLRSDSQGPGGVNVLMLAMHWPLCNFNSCGLGIKMGSKEY